MQIARPVTFLTKRIPFFLILAGLGISVFGAAPNLFGFNHSGGFGPNQLSVVSGGSVIFLTGILFFLPRSVRMIGDWLFLAFGVAASAFAADLFIVQGLPGFAPKLILVFSVLLCTAIWYYRPDADSARELDKISGTVQLPVKVDLAGTFEFISLVLQLILMLLLIQQFKLENQAFYNNIIPLVFFAFLIHSVFPQKLRLPFFLGISITAILGLLGLQNGLWLIGAGLCLLIITRLPIPFWGRVILLLLAAGLLTLLRIEVLPAPWSQAIWPVFGSIFMFRLIVYMYDLKHSKENPGFFSTLSYFFLLPNVVFPLFPVIDFAAFRKTYYNEKAYTIYQSGIRWMFWGAVHLILYRAVNYYFVLSPESVTNGFELYRFIVSNLVLLLRISGQFHMIIGILHLFGFNLPRTMHEYFLSSSYTDLWRRANIYWKDFMLKVFYYPVYFMLRKLGPTGQLVIATFFVFVVTWFLHAYQWFWLRGSFLLTAPDVAYWAIFGMLVLFNILYETKHGRKRSLGKVKVTFRMFLVKVLATTGTFLSLAVLWSLWTSSSIPDWFSLWSVLFRDPGSLAQFFFLVIATLLVFGVIIWIKEKNWSVAFPGKQTFVKYALGNGAFISIVFLIGNPMIYSHFGGKVQQILSDLTTARLSDRDAQLLVKGYYEDLLGVDRFNTDLWDIYNKRPTDWPAIQETEAGRETRDFFIVELVPSTAIEFHGSDFSINQWGFRDKEYKQAAPEDTFRVVLLGPSFVMGSGVSNDETFEAVLEERLNSENMGTVYSEYEILNFGMAGYSALQELWAYESRALSFRPQAAFYVAHQLETDILVRNLADRAVRGAELPYEHLVDVINRAGVRTGMSSEEAERRLQPFGAELVAWTYQRFVQISQENDVLPVWVFLPTLEASVDLEIAQELEEEAVTAGFKIVSLADVYQGKDIRSLIVADWDYHPNQEGHKMVAVRLYQEILSTPELSQAFGIKQ